MRGHSYKNPYSGSIYVQPYIKALQGDNQKHCIYKIGNVKIKWMLNLYGILINWEKVEVNKMPKMMYSYTWFSYTEVRQKRLRKSLVIDLYWVQASIETLATSKKDLKVKESSHKRSSKTSSCSVPILAS